MSVEINPPFRVFTDVDGEPLEDGYIHVGAVNQNPQAVPISVFWDSALTIPAAQPIRTLGGYPSRTGTPSRMYVAGDAYSISVLNKNSTLIYSDLDNRAGDAGLRQDLSDDTDPLLGAGLSGFDPALAYAPGTVGGALADLDLNAQRVSDDYTLIRDSFRKVGARAGGIGTHLQGVITGDSLAFNGFGYPGGWPTSGSGYATANPFGLSSWAHLLRDLLVTATPSFTPIKDVDFDTDALLFPGFGDPWDFGLNGKQITFSFNAGVTTSLRIRHTYSGARALMVSYAPAASAVTFDVDGVSYSTLSPDGAYQSRGYFYVPCASAETVINNVVAVAAGDANLVIYGTINSTAKTPALTGKGAWTSGQILAEYPTLVAPFAPDYIVYIIGANDIASGVPLATFETNLRDFIALAKAAKPACEILLISTPPSSSYSRTLARTYIKVMRDVAESEGTSLIDLHTQLEQSAIGDYRFDNIHFNTVGDTLVFNIIKDLCFSEVAVDVNKFAPVREAQLGVGGYFYRPDVESITVLATLGAAVTYNHLGIVRAAPTAVYEGSGTTSRVVFTPPPGYKISSVQSVAGAVGVSAEVTGVGLAGNAVRVAMSSAGAYIDLINTGKFMLLSYHRV